MGATVLSKRYEETSKRHSDEKIVCGENKLEKLV